MLTKLSRITNSMQVFTIRRCWLTCFPSFPDRAVQSHKISIASTTYSAPSAAILSPKISIASTTYSAPSAGRAVLSSKSSIATTTHSASRAVLSPIFSIATTTHPAGRAVSSPKIPIATTTYSAPTTSRIVLPPITHMRGISDTSFYKRLFNKIRDVN